MESGATERELRIRNRIAEVFLTASDRDLFPRVLDIVLEAMSSRYGVFGYLDEQGNLTVPSITDQIWDQCQVQDKTTVFPRETWGGIWGRALVEGATQLSNRPLHVPPGHLPIERGLSVPLVHQGSVIGLFTVANKSQDYTAGDQALLERLADAVAPVLAARLERDRQENERRKAEKALRLSESKLRSLFRAAPIGIALSSDRIILEANDLLCTMTGYSLEELRGHSTRLLYPDEEEFLRVGDLHYRHIRERGIASDETRWRRKDGTILNVLLNSAPLDPDDWSKGITVTATDITARRKIEAELLEAQKLESVGRLAGGVAHDFNNLLTVIGGYSQLVLMRLAADDPLRPAIEKIAAGADRAAELTRQLLAFSRKQVLRPELVGLNCTIRAMHEALQRMLGIEIRLETELAPDLWPANLDPANLEQVILNLVVNARDAMPQGGRLRLSTRNQVAILEGDSTPKPWVVLEVSDSGLGMDEETRKRIFEPFFTTRETGKGSGLGLSMVYGMVRQSGGQIDVESQPGQGTTFRVSFPKAEGEISMPCEEDAGGQRGTETLLVVSDQASVRGEVAQALGGRGYRVLEAASGGEAMELAASEAGAVRLLLIDRTGPVPDGSGLWDRMAAAWPGMKVLWLGGEDGGPAPTLAKPFTAGELAAKVRAVLGPAVAPACVLVVDDEDSVRHLLSCVLEESGYTVVQAADGKEALNVAATAKPDLVLTDLVMPEQEGVETIQTLRKLYPNLKIVAISGAFGGQFLKFAGYLGADATLSKPIPPDVLVATVRRLVGR